MLNVKDINPKIISLADSVLAKVNYELDVRVEKNLFYALAFHQDRFEEFILNQNIYSNHVLTT